VSSPVTPIVPQAVGSAEEAVNRLLKECRQGGPLYFRHPRVVAQVSRNARWLLNALGASSRASSEANADEVDPTS
jgi:hypothetical protein